MSSLARLSLANRGLTALVTVVVAAFGLFAIPSLKQQLFPTLDFPAAFISATYPGASPEVVERQVTEPIETALQGTAGLHQVTSTSREGSATVQVEFEFGTDLTSSVASMQDSLGRIQARLPQGVTPAVFAGSTADFPVLVLAVGSSADERELVQRLNTAVVPELQSIDGVRTAEVTGARGDQVVITPNPAALAAGLDVTALGTALRSNGVAIPAGSLTEGDTTLNVQVGTPLSTLDDLRDIYLAGPDGAVRLGDVASIEQELTEPTSITRTNGQPSLGISVTATPDGNAVRISHEIRDRLPALADSLGGDATLVPVFDQAPFVERSIEGLTTEGGLGLTMAVIVILVFLLSIRSTVVTAVSIPLSVLVALLALWGLDYSLNILTLGALTIAIGRVVDDSIVVLENIKRHLGYGEEKRQAILDAVGEVAGAVTASTLTTVAVFLPIALVGGLVGQLFTSFAVTVTVALLASLLVSLTVIPVLAYWFLRPATGTNAEAVRTGAERRERHSPLQRAYIPVIRFATRRRWTTLGIAAVIAFATLGMGGLLKTNFFDQSEETTLGITQTMPAGTSLATTDAAARQVEAVLARTDGVQTYQVTIGGGGFFGFGGGSASSASYSVTIDEDARVLEVQQALRSELAGLTGAGEIVVEAGGGGGFSATQLEVVVQAADEATLRAATDQVQQAMAGTPEVVDVTSDLAQSTPRISVQVDRAAAAANGLTEASIGQVVAAAFRGAPLGQLTLDGHQLDVVLRLGLAPATVQQLRALPLPTPTGLVSLGDVAKVSEGDGPVQVSRIDGQRSVTVTGTATGRNLGATISELTNRLDELSLPAGASWSMGGVGSDQSEAFGALGLALIAAVAIVFIIMAATFRSLVQPLILLVSIPFAATGAIGMLLATGTALGVPALIGMLMLIGIVVTNAIVLLDLINQYRRSGMSVADAVIEGGRRRLRPILMTAVATIFALLPMALGLTGSGGFISKPLAIVVIGGLISSTLLTLVLVPTLYSMVEGRSERRAARRRGPDPAIAEQELAAAEA